MKRPALLLLSLLPLAPNIQAAENPHGLPDGLYTEITTERGVVVCELFHRKTPMTVANHVGLAEGTLGPAPRKPFYEGSRWHRVVPDFVVQGGAAVERGRGAGYQFPDEIVPGLRHDAAGTLQMANGGPDSNGSQYCLMLSPQQRLNYLHTVFGRVVRGLEVLPKIQQGDTMRVKILRLGDEAKAFRADETAFNELLARAKRYSGPREPGSGAPFDDPDKLLPTEPSRARHFNFKLANFERFTGQKIAARLFASQAAVIKESSLDTWLQHEAARLGVANTGALAVYFADQDRWHLRIGEATVPVFVRSTPLGEPSTESKSLEQATAEFLSAAKGRGDEFVAKAEKSAPAGAPLSAGQKLKLHVDAVLDGLIFKLEPK